MNLDEAIKHAKEKSLGESMCGKDHLQLAEWLAELKQLRKEVADLRIEKAYNDRYKWIIPD